MGLIIMSIPCHFNLLVMPTQMHAIHDNYDIKNYNFTMEIQNNM